MTQDEPIRVELGREELELVVVALKMLLSAEDDPSTIARLKPLIPRLAGLAVGEPGVGATPPDPRRAA